jgi:hypothetical protein
MKPKVILRGWRAGRLAHFVGLQRHMTGCAGSPVP